jgi:hypothetical protein
VSAPGVHQSYPDLHARAKAQECRDDLRRLEERYGQLEVTVNRLCIAFTVMVCAAAILACAGYVYALIVSRAL